MSTLHIVFACVLQTKPSPNKKNKNIKTFIKVSQNLINAYQKLIFFIFKCGDSHIIRDF